MMIIRSKHEFDAALVKHQAWLATPLYARQDNDSVKLTVADGIDLCGVVVNGSLRGANLSCAVITSTALRGLDFGAANLAAIVLEHSELDGSDFTCASLSSSSCAGAKFRRCNFLSANLKFGDFDNCDFTGANFADTGLSNASFKGAILTGTCLDPAAPIPAIADADLAGFDLRIEAGIEYVYGYRTRRSKHIGITEYEPGMTYTAPWFSVCPDTSCHPGIYMATAAWLAAEYPYSNKVRCRCLRKDLHKAGDKFRAKAIEVLPYE